jgi:hypothetical protein
MSVLPQMNRRLDQYSNVVEPTEYRYLRAVELMDGPPSRRTSATVADHVKSPKSYDTMLAAAAAPRHVVAGEWSEV